VHGRPLQAAGADLGNVLVVGTEIRKLKVTSLLINVNHLQDVDSKFAQSPFKIDTVLLKDNL
jgi:hypothetical protein